MSFPTLLSMLSTAFALAALIVSLVRIQLPRRKLGAIDLQLGDIDHDIQSIRSSIRRLNARVGMREARAKKNGPETDETDESDSFAQRPGETPEQWKERMRKGPLRRGIRPG